MGKEKKVFVTFDNKMYFCKTVDIELVGIKETEDNLYEICNINDEELFEKVESFSTQDGLLIEYTEPAKWADDNIIYGNFHDYKILKEKEEKITITFYDKLIQLNNGERFNIYSNDYSDMPYFVIRDEKKNELENEEEEELER